MFAFGSMLFNSLSFQFAGQLQRAKAYPMERVLLSRAFERLTFQLSKFSIRCLADIQLQQH